MLVSLGASFEHVELRFDPEPGAYDGHSHAHAGDIDTKSTTIGEQLSIAAHARQAQR
jgi:hypothetical protein